MRCFAFRPLSVPASSRRSMSAPENTRNISLRTTSVDSPMPCTNVSTCSMAGVSIMSNPYAPKSSRATSCMCCHARMYPPYRSSVPWIF